MRESRVALRIDVVERHPPRFLRVAHVHPMVDDDEHLGQRHQPLAPQRVHHLVRLPRILLLDRDEHQVVKDPFGRHVVVDDLGNRQLEQRKEDSLGGVAEVEVFHRRTPDDRRRKNRIAAAS